MRFTDNHSPNFCNPSLLIIGDGESDQIKINITFFPFRLDSRKLPIEVMNPSFNPTKGEINLTGNILTIKFDKILQKNELCAVRFFFIFEGEK